MTTPQHPTDTLHYAHTATTRTGDLAELHVLAVTFDVDGYARVHADALIPLVKAAGYARIDSLDELPHSLRSLASGPVDDYVDQGDEPHDDQPDDHVDPWAHPKHACTASRVISDADTHAAGRIANCDSRDHADGLHSGRVQSNDGTTTSRYTWPMEPDRAPSDRRMLSLG